MKISCTRCGANVVYVPSKKKCFCEHCKSLIDIHEFDSIKNDVILEECSCSSCGAKLLVDETTMVTVCVYCGSRQIVRNSFDGKVKIDGIIPFNIDRKEFIEKADEFLRSRFIAPNDFRYDTPITEVKGTYIMAKFYKTNTRVYSRGIDMYGKLFEFSYEMHSTYIQDASSSMPDNVMDAILPFDLKGVKQYNPAYLTGFCADKGNEIGSVLTQKIKKSEVDYVREEFSNYLSSCSTHSLYEKDGLRIEYLPSLQREPLEQKAGIRVVNSLLEEEKDILVPLWLFSVKYKGEEYVYAMNGQSGAIYGGSLNSSIIGDNHIKRFPVSIPKLLFILLGIFIFIKNFILIKSPGIIEFLPLLIYFFIYYEIQTFSPYKLKRIIKKITSHFSTVRRGVEVKTNKFQYLSYPIKTWYEKKFPEKELSTYHENMFCSEKDFIPYDKRIEELKEDIIKRQYEVR